VISKTQKSACKSENPLLSFTSCCYNLIPFEARMISKLESLDMFCICS